MLYGVKPASYSLVNKHAAQITCNTNRISIADSSHEGNVSSASSMNVTTPKGIASFAHFNVL